MPELTDNPIQHRFEMVVDGSVAFVTYADRGDRIALNHTEVPEALSGRGIGSQLARAALEEVRARGLKIVPVCEFIASYIQRHPEYRDMVAV